MPVDPQIEIQKTPSSPSPETLRVRCPHCRKLYLVQYGDIQEAKPRFECVQCHSRFWMLMSETSLHQEVIGIPVEVKQPVSSPNPKPATRDLSPCPRCFKMNELSTKECTHCGVVIAKFKNAFSVQENFPAHSAGLESAWQKILADYGNESLHDSFLSRCQKENNLAYAAAVYSQMVKIMPTDELTRQRLTGIQKMGEMLVRPTRSSFETLAPRRLPRVWQLPLFAGTLLLVFGFSSPVFRNMAGVGAAFIFLAIALQIQLRRR